MLPRLFTQTGRSILRVSSLSRGLTTASVRMAGGDTGAPRSGGAARGDAFTKREQANEELAMRQREMEKLAALKEKINSHQKHLDDLGGIVDEELSGKDDKSKK